MSTIYIDYNKKITSPKGLIYNNQAAGIVIKNIKNFSLAYLNNNPNTSYTVFIGKNKIPGVIFGGKQMIIKYIPKYSQIKTGDKVITSGLDKIFYEGINVGIITKIIKKNLYQEAIIQPFYNPLDPSFFYVVGN
jgi:rod shape-determining protein MreC